MALLFVTFCFTVVASAAGFEPSVNTSDHIGDIVYHNNGTVSYGIANGTQVVANPSMTSPLSASNVTLANGTTIFVDKIDPGSNYSIDYAIAGSDVKLPLTLKETITPGSLTAGVQQQIRLCVEIKNTGNGNITGFKYQKKLPAGLSKVWTAYDGGTLCINDSVTWTVGTIAPGETKHLAIAFNVTPTSNIYFPEAYIWFTYNASLADGTPGFSGNTITSFQVQKSHPSAGIWLVSAIVPDSSEFVIDLNSVSLSRSDATDPFNTNTIASYTPNQVLNPGCSWETTIVDHFDPVPVYFIKVSYSMPYMIDRKSYLTNPAKTEPFTIIVSSPPPTPTAIPMATFQPYSPPVISTPTPVPATSSPPLENPDVMFMTPDHGEVIKNNTTDIQVSVPPSSDPGFIVYYGSPDNKTWIKLGEAPVAGNMSELMWSVPQMNGTYYLKAEHYNSWGLRGLAYTQVLVAREILPLGITSLMVSSIDWLMLLIAIGVMLLVLFGLLPYLRGGQVIYDTSALYALSRGDKDWASKLSGKVIRPDIQAYDIEGVGTIKAVAVKNLDEAKRMERELGLSPYDAMALQLAKETGATVLTDDRKILDLCKNDDIRAKRMEKNEK